MKASYRRAGGQDHSVEVEATGPLSAHVVTGDLDEQFRVLPLGPGRFRLSNGKQSWHVCVDRDGAWRHVTVEGEGEARFERDQGTRSRRREAAEGSLASPMPGTIVKVLVSAGDTVEQGQDLVVVEAMKMEIKISAPTSGTVLSVAAREGEPCDAGQTLVEVGAGDTG